MARSQTTTTATTLSAGAIGGGRSNILDTTDSHTATSQGTEGRLGTRAGGLGSVTASSTDLDVEGVDAQILAALSNVLCRKHGSVRGRFVTISLDLPIVESVRALEKKAASS